MSLYDAYIVPSMSVLYRISYCIWEQRTNFVLICKDYRFAWMFERFCLVWMLIFVFGKSISVQNLLNSCDETADVYICYYREPLFGAMHLIS
jgi:hypothetical protein